MINPRKVLRSVLAAALLAALVITAVAVASNTPRSPRPSARASKMPTQQSSVATRPSTAARPRVATRTRAARARAAVAGQGSPELTAALALFRRAETAGDKYPDAKPGDIVRKATDVHFNFGADNHTYSASVYLIQRGDEICVMLGTPGACAPISAITKKPLVFGGASADGSWLVGVVTDDVTEVEVTDDKGATYSATPRNNVYALTVNGGPPAAISLNHADGTSSSAYGTP